MLGTMKTKTKTKSTTPERKPIRIRMLRMARQMSATQLAIVSGIGLPEISLLERGAIGLGPKRAAKLAAALGVDVGDLVA